MVPVERRQLPWSCAHVHRSPDLPPQAWHHGRVRPRDARGIGAVAGAAGIAVLDYGASLYAEAGHEEAYLIRSVASLAEHREQEDQFYASKAWVEGPCAAIVSRIEQCHTVVFEAGGAVAQALQLRVGRLA